MILSKEEVKDGNTDILTQILQLIQQYSEEYRVKKVTFTTPDKVIKFSCIERDEQY